MSDPRVTLPDPKTPQLSLCHVVTPNTPLFDNQGLRNGLQTELLHGQGFKVYGVGKDWYWGQSVPLIKGSKRQGYVGYVPRKALSDMPFKAGYYVRAVRAPIFSKPDIKSHIIYALPMNSRLEAKQFNEDFLQMGAGAYLHRRHASSMTSRDVAKDYVTVAEQFLGAPYVWGGTGLMGLDCSGLVQMALCAAGFDAPRDADMQEAQLGKVVRGQLERGDLVFWLGHVGIMINPDTLLHANAFHMITAIEPYNEAVARIGPPRSKKRL